LAVPSAVIVKLTISFQGAAILPTVEQGMICIILCQSLTTFYRPIVLVHLDERTGNIYILTGDELEIEINRGGTWIFLP
jgi:hypothetical protein